MAGLLPLAGKLAVGIGANILGRKIFPGKKKEEEGIQISDRAATDDEVKVAAEKRRKKIQSGIDAKKRSPTLVNNKQTFGG